MALTDQQLQNAIIEVLKIIGVSKLPSELAGLATAPDKLHFLHIQKGAEDGQRINIEQVRGFFGAYDPVTNTPALNNATGTESTYYIASAAGSRDFGNGVVDIAVDDILEFKGGKWKVAQVSEVVASSTQTISLGEIGPTTPIEEAFNNFHNQNPVAIQPLSKGLTLIKATRETTPVSWLFVGDSGLYDEVNTTDALDFFTISGSGSIVQDSTINGNIKVNGTEIVVYDETAIADRVGANETKLEGIEDNATADQTGAEIISAIDATLGSSEWKTQRTLEQIQDIVGAMFQAGVHTNITATYDDTAGTLNLTGTAGGTGTTDEEIQDIVAGFALAGNGITIVYDDLNNTIQFGLSGLSFTTADKNKLDGIEAGANNYEHPASHPATMITEDTAHRFVTDTEKADWNAKQEAIGYTPANDEEVVKGILGEGGVEIPKDANGKVQLPPAGAERFGVTGEDDTMTALRKINMAGFQLQFDNGDILNARENATGYRKFLDSNLFSTRAAHYRPDGTYGELKSGSNYAIIVAFNPTTSELFEVRASNTGISIENGLETLSLPPNKGGYLPLTVNGIPADATGNIPITGQTGTEIVSAINAELGSTEWQTQKTLEQIQDIVGAMLQAGTHTNISVVYDDTAGTLNLTGATAGSSTSEEDIEDIVAGFALQGTGISIVYDDVANTLAFSLSGESFTTAYKNKLDGIEAGANNYQHPASHPATMITEDTAHRFVTDTEKAAWNGKQDALGFTPEKKRTVKPISNTSQYTLIAADFTDFILDFTANAGESISVILNTGVAPAGGQIQAISSGNNFLVPTAGTGITLLRPEGTNLKTTAKGWIGLIPLSAANTFGVNGNLESTEGGGETYTVFTATQDGLVPTPNEVGTTKFLRQDGAWVVPDGASYSVFTNTADGLVPAPNVSGSGYSVTITSPTEGQTFTEGETISLTSQITTIAAAKKVLKSTGWEFETADEVVTIFDADLVSGEYFLTQNDHRKVLWFNTTAAVVTIAFDAYTLSDDFEFHGIAPANGDNLDFRAYGPNYNSTQVSEGNLPIIISKGVFKGKKITGNTLNISGDTIKEYDIFQSPNGTKYKVSVSDAGALTVTAI